MITVPRGDYAEQWSHHNIDALIISTKDYIVHLDDDGDLDWETTPEYDREIKQNQEYDLKKHNTILNDPPAMWPSLYAS